MPKAFNELDQMSKNAVASHCCLAIVVGLMVLINIIMIAANSASPDDWMGTWHDLKNSEHGDFVCSVPASANGGTCNGLSLGFGTSATASGSKCFIGGQNVYGRDAAQASCKAMNSQANLAIIENAAENAVAYSKCMNTATETACFHGYISNGGDSSDPANWVWINGAQSTYTNWWKPDGMGGHEEPNESNENSASFFTEKLKKDVEGLLFFLLIIFIIWLFVVISCCSTNLALFWCGFSQDNKCCVCTGTSLDGVMVGVTMIFGFSGIRDGNWGWVIMNLIIAIFFLVGSILGCMTCSKVGVQQPGQQPGVYMGAPVVGQPAVVGNVIEPK